MQPDSTALPPPADSLWTEQAVADAHRSSLQRRNEAIARLAEMLNDTLVEKRHAAQLCPACYYLEGPTQDAGRKTHPSKCCGTRVRSGVIRMQLLCPDCSSARGLCIRCGAPIDAGLPTEKGTAANG